MVRRFGWLLLAALFSLSCSDDDGELLRVDVITDYVPGLEFTVVEVAVEDADFQFRRPITATDEFLRGQRVGELQTAGEETLTLVGRLLDADGNAIAQRRVSVPLRQRTTQTLVFTRNCADVSCPAADPAATECQGGVCVSPDCSPENPEACGTESSCTADDECEAPAAECAEARCLEGLCLAAEIAGSCESDEVCQPAEGCVTRPIPSDMGMPDGSVGDGGPVGADGGTPLDFGMPECAVDGDCDDGAFCNGPERCLEGACQPAERAVECDDGVACTVDSCDEGADACAATADDGMCTVEADGTCDPDTGCQYPVCTPATCAAGPCQTASCEGDLCVRTNLCGGSEICCGGSCVPAGCDDGNPCTDDSCGGSGCVNTNNSDPCTDGNACTVGDQCAGGSCGSGSPLSCNDLNPCTNDSCSPATGCVNTNNSASCNDGNACTVGDQCSGGSCGAGSPRDCDDSNVCTNDSCNPSTGCVNTNNTASCSDGDACTVGDQCSGGSCASGGPRDCDDSNPCTNDSCDSATGCRNGNIAAGTSCGADSCGFWTVCSGGSCFPDGGTRNRTCTPRECDGSGSCEDGTSYLDSESCTIPNGGGCFICGEGSCGPMASICEGICESGCCTDMF